MEMRATLAPGKSNCQHQALLGLRVETSWSRPRKRVRAWIVVIHHESDVGTVGGMGVRDQFSTLMKYMEEGLGDREFSETHLVFLSVLNEPVDSECRNYL